jgi:hypothetical protein
MSELVTRIDCEQLREWHACYYDECVPNDEVDARMRKWMGGDSITPLAAMDLDVVPITDRIWLATRPGVLSERNLRHLACDFAEHVLPYFERACPCDKRPRVAIETARRYADGETTKQEMREAALRLLRLLRLLRRLLRLLRRLLRLRRRLRLLRRLLRLLRLRLLRRRRLLRLRRLRRRLRRLRRRHLPRLPRL